MTDKQERVDALLPCPFCGAMIEGIYAKRDLTWIEHRNPTGECPIEDGFWASYSSWTTRAPTEQAETIARLREALDEDRLTTILSGRVTNACAPLGDWHARQCAITIRAALEPTKA